MLASCPASILNHFSTLLGIPLRFGINSSRSRPNSMTKVFNLYEAKNQLSSLVDRAASGEEIVIAKHGKPRAKLVPRELLKLFGYDP
jgi:prevent-host-death family protein